MYVWFHVRTNFELITLFRILIDIDIITFLIENIKMPTFKLCECFISVCCVYI